MKLAKLTVHPKFHLKKVILGSSGYTKKAKFLPQPGQVSKMTSGRVLGITATDQDSRNGSAIYAIVRSF